MALAKSDAASAGSALAILNSCLHIMESVLSQEELPDFYEENLENIAGILSFVLVEAAPEVATNELIRCRQKAVRLVHMYQFKFSEYFAKYSGFFF